MAKRTKRTVEYEVTGAFGSSSRGDRLEAIVLLEDSCGDALIYHPRGRDALGKVECGSLEMAHDRGDGVYVSSVVNDLDGWINVTSQPDLDALVQNIASLRYLPFPEDRGN
jgi:hypothetical protein